VWNSDSTMSEMLIGGGADVNAVDNEGRTPLDAAMDCRFAHLAMCLAEHGARTTKTPPRNIAEAAMVRQIEAVRDFLAAGCDVDAKDSRGYTALHYAAMREEKALCELLIDHGADCDAHTNAGHNTPLHLAASPEIVRLLAASGANMDETALYGWTALYRAAYDGDIERARLLIEEGADVNAPYAAEQATPLDAAKSEAMKRLLRDHGALSYEDLTEEERE
jgi:ankyrin repeat protein